MEFIKVLGLENTSPIYCSNGVIDNGETDVDCGGECPKCDDMAYIEDPDAPPPKFIKLMTFDEILKRSTE